MYIYIDLSLSLSLTHTDSLSLSLACSHTHTHTHTGLSGLPPNVYHPGHFLQRLGVSSQTQGTEHILLFYFTTTFLQLVLNYFTVPQRLGFPV